MKKINSYMMYLCADYYCDKYSKIIEDYHNFFDVKEDTELLDVVRLAIKEKMKEMLR